MGIRFIDLHHTLTRALPLAGYRDIRQRPSAAELEVEAEFAEALEEPLLDTYQYPLRNGVDAVPEDEDEVLPWILAALAAPAAVRGLRSVLQVYLRQGFNVGGQTALAEMGSDETFNLQDAALIASINRWAASLVNTASSISLTRTTANELTAWIINGRAEGLTNAELEEVLSSFSRYGATRRSGNISANETVRYTRTGSAHTYYRNGVRQVVHKIAPEASQSGPCTICEPLDGRVFAIVSGVVVGSDIPLHNGCVCYHEPVIEQLPEEVWTGG